MEHDKRTYHQSPPWSPYLGGAVDAGITTQQNNHFANNTYTGDWQFDWATPSPLTFSQWQGGPYNQDAGSTLNGVSSTPPPPGNLLDADTATFEGSIGHWIPWFSSSVAQTTAQAEAGSHSLAVTVTAPYGWGVQLDDWPGFAASSGPQTISFWGLAGNGALGADMQVQWRNMAGDGLATSDVAIGSLTASWQQASADVTAPAGTATATATFTGPAGGTGVPGNVIYLDQIFVGPPTSPGLNLLDGDTASIEGSAGHWMPWFSTSVAQSAAQTEAGTHSLQVNVTAPYGWGVELDLFPGFAASPGPLTISFWGLAGSGTLSADMQVQWRATDGSVLGTASASIPSLTSSWQEATASASAPPGTVTVTVSGTGGVAGNSLYLDDIWVGS